MDSKYIKIAKEFLDSNSKPLGKGENGTVYRLKDKIIKLNFSEEIKTDEYNNSHILLNKLYEVGTKVQKSFDFGNFNYNNKNVNFQVLSYIDAEHCDVNKFESPQLMNLLKSTYELHKKLIELTKSIDDIKIEIATPNFDYIKNNIVNNFHFDKEIVEYQKRTINDEMFNKISKNEYILVHQDTNISNILFDKNNVVWFLDPSFLYAPSVYQIGSFFWNYFEIIHKNIDEAINEWNKLSNEKLNKREVLLFMLPWAFLVGSFFANKKIKGDFDKYLMNLVKDSSKWIWEEIDKIDNLI